MRAAAQRTLADTASGAEPNAALIDAITAAVEKRLDVMQERIDAIQAGQIEVRSRSGASVLELPVCARPSPLPERATPKLALPRPYGGTERERAKGVARAWLLRTHTFLGKANIPFIAVADEILEGEAYTLLHC